MASPQSFAREQVLELGPDRNVVAIATEPALPRRGPAVLLVNAGVIHRVGPHRLHVRLARALAEAGFATLRMDLSGIGDSRALPDQTTFRASSIADIRGAIDHLAKDDPGATAIVFGICSGADNALAAAEADPRIVGVVLVDPPSYATFRSRLRALWPRLGRPDFWGAIPMKLLRRARGSRRMPARTQEGRQPPPRAVHRAQLAGLVARGVRILSLHTAALGVRHNHRDQIYESFPELRGRLESGYFPRANHTFTELAQQADLIVAVRAWCQRQFPAV